MVAIAKRLVSAHKVSLLQREHFQATHDPLTGLINQVALEERIEHEIAIGARYQKSFALLMLEIDQFQDLSQNFSKSISNKLLIDFSYRLKACVRSTDTVARFENNIFVILLPDVPDVRNAVKVIQSINVELLSPFPIEDKELLLTPTIGVSLYPSDGESKQQVIEQAHIAMCQARNEHGRNYRYYSTDVDSEVELKISTEEKIRYAIDSHNYEICYQPVHALENSVTSFVEARFQWNDPGLYGLSHGHVLDAINSMEMGKLFTDISLNEVCQQISIWEAGRANTKVPVLFELTYSQFQEVDLANRFAMILKNQNVSPGGIALVISESSIIEEIEFALHQLKSLKEVGFKIVIDKFCCGLSYIGKMPAGLVDLIRVDARMITDLNTQRDYLCVLDGIVKIANQLHIGSIIPGVNSEGHYRNLQKIASGYWQGDYSDLMSSNIYGVETGNEVYPGQVFSKYRNP